MDQPRKIVRVTDEDRPDHPPSDSVAGIAPAPGYRRDAHAVIIGIDHYNDPLIPDLKYAKADAEALYKVLTDPSLGRFSPDNVDLLLDSAATERAIRKVLGHTLPDRAGSEDTVIVYFAGHGAPVVRAKSGARDGMEKYLVPSDGELNNLRATAIHMEAVQKAFEYLDSKQVLFFIDSCYSGVAGGRTFARPDFSPRASLTDEFLESLAGEGRFVVTACDVNEVSLESTALGHGVFTYYLTEGLKGAADRSGQGVITVTQLYDYVHEHVVEHARKLGGSMHPIQKGSVQGRVILTQYETKAQRHAAELLANALLQEQAGELEKALDLCNEAFRHWPAGPRARIELERIRKRFEEEEGRRRERTRRLEAALYGGQEAGHLPPEDFSYAVDVLHKRPSDLNEPERRVRHFIELLADGRISPTAYLRAVHIARNAPTKEPPQQVTQPVQDIQYPEVHGPRAPENREIADAVPSKPERIRPGPGTDLSVMPPGQMPPASERRRGVPRKYWIPILPVVLLVAYVVLWSPIEPPPAEALNLVAAVNVSPHLAGAGIVLGVHEGSVYIATAGHNVDSAPDSAISVVFHSAPIDPVAATVLKSAMPKADMAVIVARGIPDGVAFAFSDRVGNSAALRSGTRVSSVNCCGDATHGDRVTGVGNLEDAGGIAFQSVDLGLGSSGGALYDQDWRIVGMVVSDEPPRGMAIPIDTVLSLARAWDVPLQLGQ